MEYSKQNDKKKKNSDTMLDDSDVSEPFRIRCNVCDDSRIDRFILDYHRHFLPAVTIILWIIFLLS